MINIHIQYYAMLFYNMAFLFAVTTVLRFLQSKGSYIQKTPKSSFEMPTLMAIVIIVYFSSVPIIINGDIDMYRFLYNENIEETGYSKEWLWDKIVNWCNFIGMTFREYLMVISLSYVGLILYSCIKLFPNNAWAAFIFFVTSYSFFGYGTNGIRNGMASSVVLAGITMLISGKSKISNLCGLACVLFATRIHSSTILPTLCVFMAFFFLKEPKYAIRFWFFSIVLSLMAGDSVANFFSELGFDDRMSNYISGSGTAVMSEFSHTGFRWDFLLYSAMPVLMAWYVTEKRKLRDRAYDIIAVTYILSNSFWIMVIRAAYSNRFAYLSWFMYPLVIAYPLLKMHVWKDQDKKTAKILLAYAGFTYFMFLIGK